MTCLRYCRGFRLGGSKHRSLLFVVFFWRQGKPRSRSFLFNSHSRIRIPQNLNGCDFSSLQKQPAAIKEREWQHFNGVTNTALKKKIVAESEDLSSICLWRRCHSDPIQSLQQVNNVTPFQDLSVLDTQRRQSETIFTQTSNYSSWIWPNSNNLPPLRKADNFWLLPSEFGASKLSLRVERSWWYEPRGCRDQTGRVLYCFLYLLQNADYWRICKAWVTRTASVGFWVVRVCRGLYRRAAAS